MRAFQSNFCLHENDCCMKTTTRWRSRGCIIKVIFDNTVVTLFVTSHALFRQPFILNPKLLTKGFDTFFVGKKGADLFEWDQWRRGLTICPAMRPFHRSGLRSQWHCSVPPDNSLKRLLVNLLQFMMQELVRWWEGDVCYLFGHCCVFSHAEPWVRSNLLPGLFWDGSPLEHLRSFYLCGIYLFCLIRLMRKYTIQVRVV